MNKLILSILFLCLLLTSCETNTQEPVTTQTEQVATASEQNQSESGNSGNVHYRNPGTGYEADYTLDADIEGDEVTTIYFGNGGYLDESHIVSSERIDESTIEVIDDRGRIFEVDADQEE
jgi:hypothetical protein